MTNPPADNPKLNFALYKLENLLNEQRENPHPDFTNITTHKDEVIARYQPVFSAGHIPVLTEAEFKSFLSFKNNHHWTSMERVGKHMVQDMGLLREALSILVDEDRPIRDRINEIRPGRSPGSESMVSHLGIPLLTAILHLTQPDKYGVWNKTSEQGLQTVKLWNKRWETELTGDSYVEMNDIYLYFAESLHIDLWTLDALWWVMKK